MSHPHQVYVICLKRHDGTPSGVDKVLDDCFYHSPEEAQDALQKYINQSPYLAIGVFPATVTL